jgi:hypothetical protein
MACVMKLLIGTNVFRDAIEIRTDEYKSEKKQIEFKPRVGLGKNAMYSGTGKMKCNFRINLDDK